LSRVLSPGQAATAVIDADGHVVEPLLAFSSLPEPHRVRIERDANGYEHVVVGDKEILAVPLGTLATPGANFSNPAEYKSLEEAWPGGSDPIARLVDMDVEGIDQAVLFPSIGLYFWALDDERAAVSLARAYNDWLAGYCSADDRRLFGAAMLALQDPAAAADELRRAVVELGFRCGFVRPNPCCGRSLSDRAYDVLWDCAEELGVPIAVHEGSSVIVPTLGSDRPFNPLVLHAISHSFEEMLGCAQLIAFGVLERHPGLRIVFLESGGGWVPFWLERLDEQAESFGGFCPEMKLLPSEYFARQCTISYEIDEPTLPALLPFIGEERVVWGSDYPHHDATFPGAVDALRRTIAPLSPANQARVLGANARRLYGLPRREDGVRGLVSDYFLAVTMREPSAIGELFAPNAVLEVGGVQVQGRDEIISFYSNGILGIEDLCPHPGNYRVQADQVVVPIDLQVNGESSRLVDTFWIADSQITQLVVSPLSASTT
jgi:predicted TIM-barrel fold metal-dependent hydrolase